MLPDASSRPGYRSEHRHCALLPLRLSRIQPAHHVTCLTRYRDDSRVTGAACNANIAIRDPTKIRQLELSAPS